MKKMLIALATAVVLIAPVSHTPVEARSFSAPAARVSPPPRVVAPAPRVTTPRPAPVQPRTRTQSSTPPPSTSTSDGFLSGFMGAMTGLFIFNWLSSDNTEEK